MEALRLGCDAFADDLNPVACLILEALTDLIPAGNGPLADSVRTHGVQLNEKLKLDLGAAYAKSPEGIAPFAFLWARTVDCESPRGVVPKYLWSGRSGLPAGEAGKLLFARSCIRDEDPFPK